MALLVGLLTLGLGAGLGALAPARAAASPGSALAPGIHVDPNSPAGQEYGIPLGQARALGGHGGLFGRGITSPSGRRSESSASRATKAAGSPAGLLAAGAGGAARAAGATGGAGRTGAGVFAAAAVARRAPRAAARGSRAAGGRRAFSPPPSRRAASPGSVMWMVLAAGIVLALGALGGQLLTSASRRVGTQAAGET